MTDLLPTPAATPTVTRATALRLDPAGLDVAVDQVDQDASVHADLGPDWSAVRGFVTVAAAVLAGSWVGHLLDGPPGIVIGAGLVAFVVFVGAHIRYSTTWTTRRRRANRTVATALPVDTYAPKGVVENRCTGTGSMGSVVFVWRCDVCRVVSIEASTRAETTDLAGTHDRLHHGRPTAVILAVAGTSQLMVSSMREVR